MHELRIVTPGNYEPFWLRNARGDVGLDVDLVASLAALLETTFKVEITPWPSLNQWALDPEIDLIVGGITVTFARKALAPFTAPYVRNGAVLVWSRGRFDPSAAIVEAANKRIGVNAGGYLERLARRDFPDASLVALDDNLSLPLGLDSKYDFFLSDRLEAPRFQARYPLQFALLPDSQLHAFWLPNPTSRAEISDAFTKIVDSSPQLLPLHQINTSLGLGEVR